MKRPYACVALAALWFSTAVPGQSPSSHWSCIDAAGKAVAADQPCPAETTLLPAGARVKPTLATIQQKPDWRSQGIPVWIWPIVGILGLAWFRTLLPENLFHKAAASAEPVARLAPVVFVPPKRVAPPSTAAALSAARPGSERPGGWTLEVITGLASNQLETLVQRLWQARGCEVARARGTDGGVEFLISRPASGKLFAIAKCAAARDDKIGSPSAKALAATGQQKAAGIVVFYSLGGFTDEALAYAKDKPIKLLASGGLLAELQLLPPGQQQVLLERTLIESGPAVARA